VTTSTAPTASTAARRLRLRLRVTGAVQGVGMRPFLYRAATELQLAGWIRNDTRGVILEVEGDRASLEAFEHRLRTAPPPRAVISGIEPEWLDPTGATGLVILASDGAGERLAAVLPDLATCPACLADIGLGDDDAAAAHEPDRRADYAFTNCTDCGPRFSIIRALPYDRPNTTMAGFELCHACRAEYDDPLDRRFHAQPTACPTCGPRLSCAHSLGSEVAFAHAVDAVQRGEIVAVKGLGGFHLVVDAANTAAVARLRERKHRPTKPLAVMVRDLDAARSLCQVSDEEAALLASPEAPIVLLRKRAAPDGAGGPGGAGVADGVAPGNPYLGVMLPYTPLHHLFMRALDGPIVATSGNLSDEPICIDEGEAAERLGGIADAFLVHDRPIERPVDDSVVQWVAGAPRPLRRSRGYAPLPVAVTTPLRPILAVGGQLKNTIALARGTDVFLSQHIGDLETVQAREAFERVIADFLRLYDVAPTVIAHDLHPEYASTVWAENGNGHGDGHGDGRGHGHGARLIGVQHHHAHLASCLADTRLDGPALGVIWDGTGLGPDGTVWGGEFLLGDAASYERVAHLRPFRLPGGDAAVREPWRVAMALAHTAWGGEGPGRVMGRVVGPDGEALFPRRDVGVLEQMLERGVRAPWTTSAGRLFDGVAALLGLCRRAGFEGEAAMALEYAVDPAETASYSFDVVGAAASSSPMIVDWEPALEALLADRARGAAVGVMAARFHNGLVEVIGRVAEEVAGRTGVEAVALSGGCFQNVVLEERTAAMLEARGLRPLLHGRVPANDGGLALGQVAVAAAAVRATS